MQLCKQLGIPTRRISGEKRIGTTGDIDFLKIRTVGDSGDLRVKYVEITTHLLLGDAGKLSFNYESELKY
jgi:hypothetical protein